MSNHQDIERARAKEWIESKGGALRDDDMVYAFCHEDSSPSAKFYGNRVYCFACHKAFFVPWATEIKRSKRITPAEYDRYRKATGQLGSYPLLKEAVAWLDQEKKLT